MACTDKNGVSVRDHYKAAANSLLPSKEAIAALESAPEMPTMAGKLWTWFGDLHARRGSGEAGPCRISWQEIETWQRVRRVALEDWELDLIFCLDDVFIKTYWENWKQNNPSK